MKYIKIQKGEIRVQPRPFEAMQFDGDNKKEIVAFTNAKSCFKYDNNMIRKNNNADIVLVTEKQEVPLSKGDWVMKYQMTEDEVQIRKCREDLFEKLYEPVK